MNITRLYLVLAGSIALIVGAGATFFPVTFHGSAGIILGAEPNLMNEMRGAGGVALIAGLFILAGSVRTNLATSALWIATLVYTGYGLGRLAGMALDGMPGSNLLTVAVLELLIGGLGAALLRKQNANVLSHPH